MDETIDNSAVQEVATHQEASPSLEKEREPAPAQALEEDPQERNWRNLRNEKKALEQRLKMQEEMMKELLQNRGPAPQQPIETDEFDSIADDDYIPKGKVAKLVEKRAAKIAEKIAKDQYRKLQEEQEKSQFLQKLQTKFPDFKDVVTPDTLSLLEEQEPDLAKSIASSNDPYSIGYQSYKYIKALNLATQVPASRRAREVEKKIEEKAQTVESPMAYDKRPIAQAYVLTEDRKKDLYNEMQKYAAMSGFTY